ncbi:MAG: peptidoglycan-binding protein LysM [Acidimicrobiia bacterium]|nr:peptidoglycan-binding protein LysM [Acidimicrobiia bacterium]MBT8216997.1 peptidoglycan-binding protein LysM [Acidimicrobiia bacterium]NNF10513.1 peptidoglycan-binding protein LysM [Acidimicrobiia bacterium]NNL70281.1 peptidoglycan-binding protein LysM [Acidimicrobiia bacterium]
MGLFDFVKNAGAKIGIGKSTEEEAQEKADAAASAAAARAKAAAAAAGRKETAEKAEEQKERRKSYELEKHVRAMGLDVEDLDIQYDDDVATITGAVDDNATRERVILAVGNTAGVAQVDDQIRVKTRGELHVEAQQDKAAKAAAEQAQSKFYTVVSGDSLSKIAKEFYGDPMKYPVIFEANEPMLKDPDLIYPGQVLRIPPADGGNGGDSVEAKAPTGVE